MLASEPGFHDTRVEPDAERGRVKWGTVSIWRWATVDTVHAT
jgi:hypothetical protein